MCITDNYILRITSIGTNVTTLTEIDPDAPNDPEKYYGVKFRTPDFLRKKGKCKIAVVNGNINVSEGNADSIVSPSRNIFMLTSNIPQLGYYTETRGLNNVLGTSVASYASTIGADMLRNINIDDANPLEFTCPELPPEIFVERMCYDGRVFKKSLSTNNLEFHITLDIQFFEDMPDKDPS